MKINPDSITLENGFTVDVRKKGHWGTGDLEINIRTPEEAEKAKALFLMSYESS